MDPPSKKGLKTSPEKIWALNLVSLARVQLFHRVAIKAPEYVLQVLAAADFGGDANWMGAVRQDLKAVGEYLHFANSGVGQLIAAHADGNHVHAMQVWAKIARHSGSKLRRKFFAFIHDPLTNTSLMRSKVRRIVTANRVFSCPECPDTFPTKQQCSVHEFKEHGRRPRLRYYLTGFSCEACLLQFGNCAKLQTHVSDRHCSPQCGAWCTEHAVPADPITVEEEIVRTRAMVAANGVAGRSKHYSGIPVVQAKGPLPLHAPEWKSNRTHSEMSIDAKYHSQTPVPVLDADVVAREALAVFFASPAFTGHRHAMIFKLGCQGLGYYIDG